MKKTAIIAGYSGLVGGHLLGALLAHKDYAQVKAVGRRSPAIQNDRLVYLPSDLVAPDRLGQTLSANDAFCCLGTTIKKAGSRAAFERVDFHMVLAFARAAYAAGARRFFLVSSLSANPKAPFYYSRIKGRAEIAVSQIGFDAVHIIRPSLLIGPRDERRAGEWLAQKASPVFNLFMQGPLKPYRAVPAHAVTQAIMELAQSEQHGSVVHTLPLSGAGSFAL